MIERSFESVHDFRRPIVMAAGAHPWNVVALSLALLTLTLAGCFLLLLAALGADAVAMMALLRSRRMRRRLDRYDNRRARIRAADRLGLEERGEWQSLEQLVRRTAPFNSRQPEAETLLNSFVDVALVHRQMKDCADGVALDTRSWQCGASPPLLDGRAQASRRATDAIAALRNQLDMTAQRIRLACEVAVAEHCEAGAELWRSEV